MMEPFKLTHSAKKPSLFLLPHWTERYAGVAAGFSSRHGGVSEPPWETLNCGLHVGDVSQDVVNNRRLLADELGWPFEAWTCAEQVHGCHVHVVEAEDRGRGADSLDSAIGDADALITNERNVLLTSLYADCVPLYFFDPSAGVIALAHAGWKGTVLEIARKTVEKMTARFGCKPEDVQAAIGPSIGLCCYEVNEVVLERAVPIMKQLNLKPAELVVPTSGGKARINLKELNRQIMIKAGILPSHIECSQWCTGCSTDLFFSHRMEGGATGRMVSWIGMREGDFNA
ncbi:peptidoglycan editing factor PgeF [Paenibacillus sp. R14(2021)]|uniref:peptidoglycan editing factor PgeF n=1 Tax=Paenibacillus sp. R14(2021) TaxID=2859228 RepID=UPI00280B951A|nr:peptidoglycan editing factor PgeF [Paenibacillus sp. R14(2021)]